MSLGKTSLYDDRKAFAPYVFPVDISDIKGVEVRGIWK